MPLLFLLEQLYLRYSCSSKNSKGILTGTTISQIIPFIISPIISRIFSPSDFGLLALFSTTALLFSNISTFQYETAIMLPKDNKDAINLVALSVVITFLVSLILLIFVFLYSQPIVKLMNNADMKNWLYLIPVSVFFAGIYRSFNMYASRMKKFKRVATRNIIQTSVNSGSRLVTGGLGYTSGTLIFSSLLGQFFSSGFLVYKSFKNKEIAWKEINLRVMLRNAKEYQDFPKYRTWMGFLNMMNETSVRYIISNFYKATTLGLYSFSMGLMQRPTQLIGQAISQVFFQKTAEFKSKGKSNWRVLNGTILALIVIGLVIYTPFFLFGRAIFSFVFGKEWLLAGTYTQFLIPWFFIKFVFTPISSIPATYGKQKQELYYRTIFNFSIPIVFVLFGKFNLGFLNTLLISSIIACVFFGLLIIWIRKLVKAEVKIIA